MTSNTSSAAMSEPPRRPIPISEKVSVPDGEALSAGERLRQARHRRMEQLEQRRAENTRARAGDHMSSLGDGISEWMQRRGRAVPERCPDCGYSGVHIKEHQFVGYCTCKWGDIARQRDDTTALVEEMEARHKAKLDKSLVLPPAYTRYSLEDHPLAKLNPDLHADIMLWVETWDWKRGLILRGDYGRGKTSYLVSIMQHFYPRAVKERWGMLYTGGSDMLARLRDGLDDETYARTRDELSHVHLLAIDDLGANQQVTPWRQDQYLSIFEYRYAHDLPTLITTNLTTEQLRAHLTERVYWRIFERCDPFEVTGPNLRNPKEVKSWA